LCYRCSRTDAGVHGLCNRAVFDTDSTIPPDKFAPAINSYLPDDIRVIRSCQVDKEWHPRKCATHKSYEYKIDCGDIANPLNSRYSWYVRGPIDIEAMKESAKYLIGEHDFTSFSSVNGTALSNVRRIISLDIEVSGRNSKGIIADNAPVYEENGKLREGMVTIRIKGNGFLYNMVRIIAGTLYAVACGRYTTDSVGDILLAQDRRKAGPTAPPMGLTLVNIEDIEEN